MITENIKVFILEDMPADAELVKRRVLKIAPNATFTLARDKREFESKIEWTTPDIILSDYALLDFNGLEAMLYVREKYPHVPFIFVTGALDNEQKVADAILRGASGYILKDNLRELPPMLEKVYLVSKKKVEAAEEVKNIKLETRLLVQQMTELLEGCADFDELNTLRELSNKVDKNLSKI